MVTAPRHRSPPGATDIGPGPEQPTHGFMVSSSQPLKANPQNALEPDVPGVVIT